MERTWYEHQTEKMVESDTCIILQDFPVHTDRVLEHNKPDITVVDKVKKTCPMTDVARPFGSRIMTKEGEKDIEMTKDWNIKQVEFGK